MISIEFECGNSHRFEGYFKNYASFREQLENKMIACPLCNINDVKRIYSGCSIRARQAEQETGHEAGWSAFSEVRRLNEFVKENFEDVGTDFADRARSLFYGSQEEWGIYGESTADEISELTDEGIPVVPMIDTDIAEH